MTRALVAEPDRPTAARRPILAAGRVRVEVLACGAVDRGDDGAALVAVRDLAGLPSDVRVRAIGRLDIDDLLEVPAGATVVIVDAATGIRPGRVLDVPLDRVLNDLDGLRPRSSHALAVPEVLGLAELLRGQPIRGRLVAIGGADFGLCGRLSERVAKAIPALVAVVRAAIEEGRIERPVEMRG